MIGFKLSTNLEKVRHEIEYLLNVWAKNQGKDIGFGSNPDNSITIGIDDNSRLVVSQAFVNNPTAFESTGIDLNGKYVIENAFKLLNCLQEYGANDVDELGRFRLRNSYQYKLRNHDENLVQKLFDQLSTRIGITSKSQKTKFFLTHDIDLVNGAFIEDGAVAASLLGLWGGLKGVA